jgi:adenylate cyclase
MNAQRDVQLLLALDHARDTLDENSEPEAMFNTLAGLIREQFKAEACAILLLEEQTQQIEYLAKVGMEAQAAETACRVAMQLDVPAPLADATTWKYSLGVRITLHDAAMGSLFIASNETPFTETDIGLLALIESQLDSAVMQARTLWKLAQRNRELETIFQIDRLRDNAKDEATLIHDFTKIAVDRLKADVCLVILSHIDGGDLVVRGMIDRANIPPQVIERITQHTATLNEPQVLDNVLMDLQLLVAPFIVSDARLGAIAVGRHKGFTLADQRLLMAMVSQMDSAVAHVRVIAQLNQRNRELETIYRIDQIRDSEGDFDLMLHLVLNEICRAISCELGYIMLYNVRGEEQLELKATTAGEILRSPDYYEVIRRVSREALDQGVVISHNEAQGAVHSIVAVPLILNERIIGVFGALNNTNGRGFSAEDRRLLSAITSQVDTAIFERLERRRMRKVMSRSVDPKVLDHLLQNADDHLLAGERVALTTIFADVRGSTEWAERTTPEDLVATINAFLGRMTDVIFHYGGTLDKFVGDEVIGMFGTPLPMSDHAYFACKTALEMQRVHRDLQAEVTGMGRELPAIGVGVSSGEAIAGEFGAPARTDFTAMGRIVNLGARLCGAAGPGQVLISEITYELLAGRARVKPLEPIIAKGIAQPVQVYELLEIMA